MPGAFEAALRSAGQRPVTRPLRPVLPRVARRPVSVMARPASRPDGDGGGGGIFGSILSGIGGVVRPVASALDFGRALALSTAMEVGDAARAIGGKDPVGDRGRIRDRGFNLGDIVENTNRRIGAGEFLEQNSITKGLPLNVKRGLGAVGDIGLDPLNYVTLGAGTAAKAGARRLAAAEGDDVARTLTREGVGAADRKIAERAVAKGEMPTRSVKSILGEGVSPKALERTMRDIERTGSGGVKLNLGRAGAPTLVRGETLGKIPGVQAVKGAGQAAKQSELGAAVRRTFVPMTETRDAFGERIAQALPGIAHRRQQMVDAAKVDLDDRLRAVLGESKLLRRDAPKVTKTELDAVRGALDVGGTVEDGLRLLDGAPDAQKLLVELDRARSIAYDSLIKAGKQPDQLMPRDEYLRHALTDEGLAALGIKAKARSNRPATRSGNLKERTREGSITEQNLAADDVSYVDDPVKLTRSSYHYAQEVLGNAGAVDALEDVARKTDGFDPAEVVRHQPAQGFTQVAPGRYVADEIAGDLFALAKSGTQSSIVRSWDAFSSILKRQTLFNPVAFGPYFTQNMATGVAMNAARLGVGPREYGLTARLHRAVAQALKGSPEVAEEALPAAKVAVREAPQETAQEAPGGWWGREGGQAVDLEAEPSLAERKAVRGEVDSLAARAHEKLGTDQDIDIVGQAGLPPIPKKPPKGGEWDWVETLSPEERAAYQWWSRFKGGANTGPDEWQLVIDAPSMDEAAQVVMQRIRAATALEQLSRGFRPWFPGDLPLDLGPAEQAIMDALPVEKVKGYAARGTRRGKAGRRSWTEPQIDKVVKATRQAGNDVAAADALGPDPGVGPWMELDEGTWKAEVDRLYEEYDEALEAAIDDPEWGKVSPAITRAEQALEKMMPSRFTEGADYSTIYTRLREQTARHHTDTAPRLAATPRGTGEELVHVARADAGDISEFRAGTTGQFGPGVYLSDKHGADHWGMVIRTSEEAGEVETQRIAARLDADPDEILSPGGVPRQVSGMGQRPGDWTDRGLLDDYPEVRERYKELAKHRSDGQALAQAAREAGYVAMDIPSEARQVVVFDPSRVRRAGGDTLVAAPLRAEPPLAAGRPQGPTVPKPMSGAGEEGFEERLAAVLPDPEQRALALELRQEGIFGAGHALYDDVAEEGLRIDPSKPKRIAELGTGTTAKVNQYGEEMLRGAAYLKARSQGLPPSDASNVVRQTHLDYSPIGRTRFERNTINRFVFFPTWLMRAPTAVVRSYAHHPGLANAQAKMEMGPKFGERERNEYGELVGARLSGPMSFLTGVPTDISDTLGVGKGEPGELLHPLARAALFPKTGRQPTLMVPPLSILMNRDGTTILGRDDEGVRGGRLGGILEPGAKRSRYQRSLVGVRTGVDYGRTGETREYGHRVGRRPVVPTFRPVPRRSLPPQQ